MSSDPIANRRWIGGGYRTRHIRRGVFATILVDGLCSVKTEQSSRRDADAASRDDDENERAGGKARTIDDNALVRLAQRLKEMDEGCRLAAGAGFNPHLGRRGHERDDKEKNGAQSAADMGRSDGHAMRHNGGTSPQLARSDQRGLSVDIAGPGRLLR